MLKIEYFLLVFSWTVLADQSQKPALFRLPMRQNISEAGRQQRIGIINPHAPERTMRIQSDEFIRGIDFSEYPKTSAFKNFVGVCFPGIGVLVGAHAMVKLYDGPLKTKKNEVIHDIKKECMKSGSPMIRLNENVFIARAVYFHHRAEIAREHIDQCGMTGREKMQFVALNTGLVCVSTLMTSIWLKCIRNYFTE
jgi:hypothetical protein